MQDANDREVDMSLLEVPLDLRSCRRLSGGLSEKVALFNKVAGEHAENQALNPFSDKFSSGRLSPRPNDPDYGKPIAGSLTDLRGRKAQTQVNKEMIELCSVINDNGHHLSSGPDDPDQRVIISFGELFQIYTYINDKLVGLLLRARRQKLVDFEGETLFQRRDDNVPIVLLKSLPEVREHFKKMEENNNH